MVEALVAALLAATVPQSDTSTFRDAATADLYARARVRHVRQDSLVRDYTATVRTRMEARGGRSRFAPRTTLLAHETVSEVSWQQPNDLSVHVVGVRAIAPIVRILAGLGDADEDVERDLRSDLVMDRPWFIPRALGDSIRLMGVPDHAALHPLGDGAVDWYRFAVVDSATLIVPGRSVRAIEMSVEPAAIGPSLVAGRMWIDAETADVVRFRMLFLGDYVWGAPEGGTARDSAEARDENALTNRILSVEAEVEYALIDRLYWMPSRQFLAITAELPWFVNLAIPARVVTTFSDYVVNGGVPIDFAIPEEDLAGRDSARARAVILRSGEVEVEVEGEEEDAAERRYREGYHRGGRWHDGRWEISVPPGDSLAAYPWVGEMRAQLDAAEETRLRETFAALSELEDQLPAEWTGRRRVSLAWETASDVLRFNRVQGPSVGIGYRLRTGMSFTSLLATARIGFADVRPTGALTLRRDGPRGRADVGLYRRVDEVEPWTAGLGLGNSLNAAFAGHDDADYHLTLGTGTSYGWHDGPLANVTVSAAYERHRSMSVAIDAPLPELWGPGDFQANPTVAEGWYLRARVRRDGGLGPVGSEQGVEGMWGGGRRAARAWLTLRIPFVLGRRSGTLSARAGTTLGDSLPQALFRLGGPQTVRGFTYGTRWGREVWAAQLDVALLGGRALAPVAFADVGDTFSGDPMVGAGIGLSLLNGLVRLNLSKGLRPTTDVRFDLLFRASR